MPHEPALAKLDLRAFVAASLAKGRLHYFEPYERVHRSNLAMVCDARPGVSRLADGLPVPQAG